MTIASVGIRRVPAASPLKMAAARPGARPAPLRQRQPLKPAARAWGDPVFEPKKSRVVRGPDVSAEEQRGPRWAVMTHHDIWGTFLAKVFITSDNPERVGTDAVFKEDPDAVFFQWLSRVDDHASGLLVRISLTDKHRPVSLPETWRQYIFNRELGVVFDWFLHAEESLLQKRPDLLEVPVFLHFQSTSYEHPEHDQIMCLGRLKTAPKLATLVANANRSFMRWENGQLRFETKNWTFPDTPEQQETLYRLADRGDSPSCPLGWKPESLKYFGLTSFSEASGVLPQVVTPDAIEGLQPIDLSEAAEPKTLRNNIVQFLRTGVPAGERLLR